MISKMEKVYINSKMEMSTKVIMYKENVPEKVSLLMPMVINMLDILRMETRMVRVPYLGKTVMFMMVHGKVINQTVTENLQPKSVISSKENSKMEKLTGMVLHITLMDGNSKAHLKMVNVMGRP